MATETKADEVRATIRIPHPMRIGQLLEGIRALEEMGAPPDALVEPERFAGSTVFTALRATWTPDS